MAHNDQRITTATIEQIGRMCLVTSSLLFKMSIVILLKWLYKFTLHTYFLRFYCSCTSVQYLLLDIFRYFAMSTCDGFNTTEELKIFSDWEYIIGN